MRRRSLILASRARVLVWVVCVWCVVVGGLASNNNAESTVWNMASREDWATAAVQQPHKKCKVRGNGHGNSIVFVLFFV